MSVSDKIALITVIAAITPMAFYFTACLVAPIILCIYGKK